MSSKTMNSISLVALTDSHLNESLRLKWKSLRQALARDGCITGDEDADSAVAISQWLQNKEMLEADRDDAITLLDQLKNEFAALKKVTNCDRCCMC